MKMEEAECFETSGHKIQTPGNYPEEGIQHSEHGESLKSRSAKRLMTQILNLVEYIHSPDLESQLAEPSVA
jgi:hypothetical protein